MKVAIVVLVVCLIAGKLHLPIAFKNKVLIINMY